MADHNQGNDIANEIGSFNLEGLVIIAGGPFSAGIAFILLWQHPSPSRLEIDISGPTPIGATILSKRIFREVKAKLIEHFGSDRVRDVSKTVVNPI